MKNVVAAIVILKLSATTVGLAQNWPHWRGPTHDGVSAEKNLPVQWSAVCAATGDDADANSVGGPSDRDASGLPTVASERVGQRPRGTNFEGRPIVPTVCDNIQTKGISWKLPLPAYSGSTPIIWGDTIFLNVATGSNNGIVELWSIDRNTKAVTWKRQLTDSNHMERKQNM